MEILAFALSVVCVWLNAQEKVLTWPFAIAASAAYALVFFEARLFGDAGLQLVFIVLAIYGWTCWQTNEGPSRKITNVPKQVLLGLALAWVMLYAAIYLVLIHYTSSDVPKTDAFLTAASLIATFMSARKWRQNWWLWGFADTIYVGLYIYKDLYITALLYGLFVILCLIGWRQWTKQMCQGA